jgi:hypothetical protein
MERMAADGGEDGGLVVGEVELQRVEVARRLGWRSRGGAAQRARNSTGEAEEGTKGRKNGSRVRVSTSQRVIYPYPLGLRVD